jgi:hypothetical protein
MYVMCSCMHCSSPYWVTFMGAHGLCPPQHTAARRTPSSSCGGCMQCTSKPGTGCQSFSFISAHRHSQLRRRTLTVWNVTGWGQGGPRPSICTNLACAPSDCDLTDVLLHACTVDVVHDNAVSQLVSRADQLLRDDLGLPLVMPLPDAV